MFWNAESVCSGNGPRGAKQTIETFLAILFFSLQQDVSLKTVLLLAIFAAVDIAASAGFVMVRVIMVSGQIKDSTVR